MSNTPLSPSNLSYLKAVWALGEWSHEPVTATMIAARVGVRMSTASDAIKKLSERGLLDHAPYGAVTLTDEGTVHAVQTVRRHRLIETFLVEALGYRWDQVHDEAERLENEVSDFMIERIDASLGNPRRDPHGDPIPGPDGTVDKPEATPLSEAKPGQSLLVERVSDSDPALLEYLAEQGVIYGAELEVQGSAPFTDTVSLTVRPSGASLSISSTAAQEVWVSERA